MALKDIFKRNINESSTINLDYSPSLNANELGVINLAEQFKGEIEQKEVKFPTDLGEEHPFDFKLMENLYKKFGYYTAVIDKYVDFVVGAGIITTCKDNEKAKEIIDNFIRDTGFDSILRAWLKEALNKGNGFLELGGSVDKGIEGMKTLNANYMYIKRDKKGTVEGYNQYKGAFDKVDRTKVIPFTPDQIAHYPFNVIGDCAYGIGIGWPALQDINNLLQNEKDSHFIMNRKANSPLHAKIGKVDGNIKIIPKKEDVEAFGAKMETMSNKTDWATDDLVELKVVDFGNIGDKFNSILEHDMQKLFYIFQIPPELMGMANIPEGMSRTRMEAFQRRIQSIQEEIEKIIEEKIFKRILMANGIDAHVEVDWGTPSVLEIEGRIQIISDLIKSPTVSLAMKKLLEEELVYTMDLDEEKWEQYKTEEEELRAREEERQQPLIPGQNAKVPVKPKTQAPPVTPQQNPNIPNPKEYMEPFLELLNKQDKDRADMQNKLMDTFLATIAKSNEERVDVLKAISDLSKKETNIKEEKNKSIDESKIKNIETIKRNDNRKGLLPKFKITKNESTDVNNLEETKDINEFVKKVGNQWCVFSHQTGKNFGCYSSKDKAEKRLAQIHTFAKYNYEVEPVCKSCEESWDNINDIEEWLGFKYKDYVKQILAKVKAYGFSDLKADNATQLEAGYLSQEQVDKLREVLENGFEQGLSMKDMAKEVESKVGIKDLYRLDENGDIKKGASGLPILQKSKENRAIGIIRSEVTRLANQGAVDYYKENGLSKVKWVASYGLRTCPDCEALNGTIYDIGAEPSMPLHPMCRCTYAPVVEIK